MYDYFNMNMPEREVNAQANLSLAYLGDAVYELLVRAHLMKNAALRASELHREAVQLVSAPSQARFAEKLLPVLTEEEFSVYKRGRNCHVNSVPQNADISQYHAATGLECLFGWLYLRGETERLCGLFSVIAEDK